MTKRCAICGEASGLFPLCIRHHAFDVLRINTRLGNVATCTDWPTHTANNMSHNEMMTDPVLADVFVFCRHETTEDAAMARQITRTRLALIGDWRKNEGLAA